MKQHAFLIAATVAGAALLAAAAAVSNVHAAAASSRATPVTYTARVFMRGMKVTVPSVRWRIHEDHPGEFNLASPSGSLAGTNLHFWLDPIATAPHAIVLPRVGRTPSALIRWLRQNHNFVVSPPDIRHIARGIAATSIDLDVAATAPREDPGCPNPCVTYFVFKGPGYRFPYGTGQGEPIRLYFATLHDAGKTHTFTISVDTPSVNAFQVVAPIAARILANVRLPAHVSAG